MILSKLKSHFRSCIGRSPNCVSIDEARIFGKKAFFCIIGSLIIIAVQTGGTGFRYFSKSARQFSCALVSTDLALSPLITVTASQW